MVCKTIKSEGAWRCESAHTQIGGRGTVAFATAKPILMHLKLCDWHPWSVVHVFCPDLAQDWIEQISNFPATRKMTRTNANELVKELKGICQARKGETNNNDQGPALKRFQPTRTHISYISLWYYSTVWSGQYGLMCSKSYSTYIGRTGFPVGVSSPTSPSSPSLVELELLS